MKKLILLSIAILALSSCEKSEQENPQPIAKTQNDTVYVIYTPEPERTPDLTLYPTGHINHN